MRIENNYSSVQNSYSSIKKQDEILKNNPSNNAVEINITNKNTTNHLRLSQKEIDEKINRLDTLKNTLHQAMQSDLLPKYNKDITIQTHVPVTQTSTNSEPFYTLTEDEIRELRKVFEPFLNPHQKFYTQQEREYFLAKQTEIELDLLNVRNGIPLDGYLTKEEIATFNRNMDKSLETNTYDTYDKHNDYDSALNLVYHEKSRVKSDSTVAELLNKQKLETNPSASITKKTQTDEEEALFETMDKIEEKVLLMSDENTTIQEKEVLLEEIKELSEDIDSNFAENLTRYIVGTGRGGTNF